VIGWLLDTNVLSELIRSGCDANVGKWAREQPEDRLFMSVLSLAEYEQGIAKLPPAAPARARLTELMNATESRFSGRVLGLSDAAVRRWGQIGGTMWRLTGQPPEVVDTLLAATAVEHDLYLVTRNVRDVRNSGAAVFNPWSDDPAGFPLRRPR